MRVVLVNSGRVTLRVVDAFLKVDADERRLGVEAEAISMAPVNHPEIVWRKPNVLAPVDPPGL